MRPSEREYLAFIELPLKIFAALVEEYMDSSVQVFITLAAWKCDSSMCREILNSRATGFKSGTLRQVGILKMWLFKCHETLESKVSCFHCVTLLHFEGLKMRFLRLSGQIYVATGFRIIFILVSWKCNSCLHGFSWKRFKHFGDLKSDSSRIMRHIGYYHPHSLCSEFCWHENEFFQRLWDPLLKKTWRTLDNFSSFRRLEKAITAV